MKTGARLGLYDYLLSFSSHIYMMAKAALVSNCGGFIRNMCFFDVYGFLGVSNGFRMPKMFSGGVWNIFEK